MIDKLYPGFSSKGNPLTRLRRLEVGSQRMQGGALRPSSGAFARVPKELLDRTGTKLDLSHPNIIKRGSNAATANTNGFAYVATTTTVHWYWDGTHSSTVIVLTRSDKTKVVIPSGDLLITGLDPDTDYYFFPYWSPTNGCNVGWVQGVWGTPLIGTGLGGISDPNIGPQFTIQQNYQDREPLSAGAMLARTTAAGSTTSVARGGGDPDGRGGCVMGGSLTEIVPLGDHDYEIEVLSQNEWVHLVADDGRELFCTPDHPLYHADNGKVDADTLSEGDWIIMDDGIRKVMETNSFERRCSKHKIKMANGHLFWANGFLSHNVKMNK